MRQVLFVVIFLFVAGCDVASRDVTDTEYLQEIDRLLQENDSCGVRRYVTSRPLSLFGSDELSRELRDFVLRNRESCAPREAGYSNDRDSDPSGGAVETSRNTSSDQSDRETASTPASREGADEDQSEQGQEDVTSNRDDSRDDDREDDDDRDDDDDDDDDDDEDRD